MTKLTLVSGSVAMTYDRMAYHRQREQQCRELAESATDPDVRRRHEELADLHAGRRSEGVELRP